MPDACGEGEYPLADSSPDALWNVSAVVFEGKLAFEAVVDRFDPLANTAELAQPRLLVYAVAADEVASRRRRSDRLEAGEAFVADDDLPAVSSPSDGRGRASLVGKSRSGSRDRLCR